MELTAQQLLHPDVRHFFKVAKMLSFSKAAEQAGVQQAALSKAVARLEHGLGQLLFIRMRSGLKLTPGGQILFERISRLEQELRQQSSGALENSDQMTGTFHLGMNESIARNILPDLFKNLQVAFPKIRLQIEFARSIEVTRKVLNREFDLGLVVNTARINDLVLAPLTRENVFLFHSSETRSGAPLLYNPLMVKVERHLHRFSKNRKVPIPDYSVLAAVAERTHWWAILPESEGARFPKLKRQASPLFSAHIQIIYRHEHMRSSAAKALIAELKKIKGP